MVDDKTDERDSRPRPDLSLVTSLSPSTNQGAAVGHVDRGRTCDCGGNMSYAEAHSAGRLQSLDPRDSSNA